jgi:hypothetical protein
VSHATRTTYTLGHGNAPGGPLVVLAALWLGGGPSQAVDYDMGTLQGPVYRRGWPAGGFCGCLLASS